MCSFRTKLLFGLSTKQSSCNSRVKIWRIVLRYCWQYLGLQKLDSRFLNTYALVRLVGIKLKSMWREQESKSGQNFKVDNRTQLWIVDDYNILRDVLLKRCSELWTLQSNLAKYTFWADWLTTTSKITRASIHKTLLANILYVFAKQLLNEYWARRDRKQPQDSLLCNSISRTSFLVLTDPVIIDSRQDDVRLKDWWKTKDVESRGVYIVAHGNDLLPRQTLMKRWRIKDWMEFNH